VSEQQDNPDFLYFERVNEELAHSLRRCHALVDDCRDKLAANSNDPAAANEPGEEDDEAGERVG
jgi:hypothetical protein